MIKRLSKIGVGTLLYDFFIIPTIRIEWSNSYFNYGFTRVTIEWLRWFIGFRIYNKDTEEHDDNRSN